MGESIQSKWERFNFFQYIKEKKGLYIQQKYKYAVIFL